MTDYDEIRKKLSRLKYEYQFKELSGPSLLNTIPPEHLDQVTAFVFETFSDILSEKAVMEVKCDAYEKIIANSNFAPILANDTGRMRNWIPIVDEASLPEVFEVVLITAYMGAPSNSMVYEGSMDASDGSKWSLFGVANADGYTITAWKPLPGPYKGDMR